MTENDHRFTWIIAAVFIVAIVILVALAVIRPGDIDESILLILLI